MKHGRTIGGPGERYAYADTGYLLLGEIIERATGTSLSIAVREQLGLRSLGLSSTYFESSESVPHDSLPLARQYIGETDVTAADPSFDLFGGGGIVSTTGDLNLFFRALLQGRVFHHRQTLAAALMTVDALHDPVDHLHANLLTTLPFGQRICWAHLGFWGSESLYCPDIDVAASFTIDQAAPRNPDTLRALAAALAAALEGWLSPK